MDADRKSADQLVALMDASVKVAGAFYKENGMWKLILRVPNWLVPEIVGCISSTGDTGYKILSLDPTSKIGVTTIMTLGMNQPLL